LFHCAHTSRTLARASLLRRETGFACAARPSLFYYERPKLQAIEPADGQINPMRVKPDLTKLTDEELDQLEKIVLRV
jgi:hypothetical protein